MEVRICPGPCTALEMVPGKEALGVLQKVCSGIRARTVSSVVFSHAVQDIWI